MMFHSKQIKPILYGNLLVLIMLLGRVLVTQKITYLFLLWNLLLAFLPLGAAVYAQAKVLGRWRLLLVSAFWLCLFPNAPYLITDLYHLAHFRGVPLWFDALLLFTSAFTGVGMGFLSLQIMEQQWRTQFFKMYSEKSRWRYRLATVVLVFLLTGFGMYLGRVLRWNSWDVLTDTQGLAYDIFSRIVHPFHHRYTWAFTGLYATILFFLYNIWCTGFVPTTKKPVA